MLKAKSSAKKKVAPKSVARIAAATIHRDASGVSLIATQGQSCATTSQHVRENDGTNLEGPRVAHWPEADSGCYVTAG